MWPCSQFRAVSWGIVAENKKRDTKIVEVLPVEILPEFADALEVVSDITEGQGVDFDGRTYLSQAERTAFLPAEWLGESNRHTAPDVRRGEAVMLWQTADADKYYWTVIGRPNSNKLRRLETVVWMWNAFPKNDDVEPDRSNCYVLEISTHDGHITLTTSEKNGEKAIYELQFNTREGNFSLEDNHGNFLTLDSVGRRWQMQNGDGSYIDMNKSVMSLFTQQAINVTTKALSVNTETINVASSTDTWSTSNMTVKADSFTRTAGSNTISGPQTHNDPVAFPAFTVGPGASAGGGGGGGAVGTISGTLEQVVGDLNVLALNADSVKAGSVVADSGDFGSLSYN